MCAHALRKSIPLYAEKEAEDEAEYFQPWVTTAVQGIHLSNGATADEMVLEFLRAEIDSPRFGTQVSTALSAHASTPEELIDKGDLKNLRQNSVRAAILGHYRGYPDAAFFRGFPADALWARCTLSPEELKNARYAKIIEWVHVSRYTRLISVAVETIARGDIGSLARNYNLSEAETDRLRKLVAHVRRVASDYEQGKKYPKLIAVRAGDQLVVLEGHTRATGFVLSGREEPVEMLIGSSKSMRTWAPLTEMIL